MPGAQRSARTQRSARPLLSCFSSFVRPLAPRTSPQGPLRNGGSDGAARSIAARSTVPLVPNWEAPGNNERGVASLPPPSPRVAAHSRATVRSSGPLGAAARRTPLRRPAPRLSPPVDFVLRVGADAERQQPPHLLDVPQRRRLPQPLLQLLRLHPRGRAGSAAGPRRGDAILCGNAERELWFLPAAPRAAGPAPAAVRARAAAAPSPASPPFRAPRRSAAIGTAGFAKAPSCAARFVRAEFGREERGEKKRAQIPRAPHRQARTERGGRER